MSNHEKNAGRRRCPTKGLLLGFIILLTAGFSARASLVSFVQKNALGQPDTNVIRVTTCDPNTNTVVNADGSVVTSGGLPALWFPGADGHVTNYLNTGNYLFVGNGWRMLYRVPDTSSNFTAYPLSAYNTFVTVVQPANPNMITNTANNVTLGGTFQGDFVATNGGAFTSYGGVEDLSGLGIFSYGGGGMHVGNNNVGFLAGIEGNGNVWTVGQFAGSGAGLSNVPATSLTGTLSIMVLPPVVPTNTLPRSNGTNDWLMLSTALMTPNSYWVSSDNYIISNTLPVTNCVMWNGNGFALNFSRGLTNSAIDCGASNSWQSFLNLTINGAEPSNYNAVATIPLPINLPEVYDSGSGLSSRGSSVRNRNGLRINALGGGIVSGCTFVGFSGCGLLVFNYNGTEAYQTINTKFDNLSASNCFIGFYAGGGYWDGIPSYQAFHNPSSYAYNSGEYIEISSSRAVNCGIGVDWYAGNSKVSGGFYNNNFVGYASSGGPNSQHGLVDNVTFNHNTWAGACSTGPQDFKGCIFYANVNPFLVGDNEHVSFVGCTSGNLPFAIVTNSTTIQRGFPGEARFYACITTGASAVSATNYAVVTSTNCIAYGQGNYMDGGAFFSITNATATGNGIVSYFDMYGGVNADGSGLTNLTVPSIAFAGQIQNGNITGNLWFPVGNQTSQDGLNGWGNYKGMILPPGTYSNLVVSQDFPAIPASTNLIVSIEAGNVTVLTNVFLMGPTIASSPNITNSGSQTFTLTTNALVDLWVGSSSNTIPGCYMKWSLQKIK